MPTDISTLCMGLVVGVAGGIVVGGLLFGHHDQVKAEKAAVHAIAVARETEHSQAAAVQAVAVRGETAAAKIRIQTREVIRNVPQYLPAPVVARYPLPAGFVQLVNAGITGEESAAPAGPVDAPSAVATDDAAETLVDDFGLCREAYRRNDEWLAYAHALGLVPRQIETATTTTTQGGTQ